MNKLQNEQSAYLRSAAHQPIHWFGWGDEAFATARAQQKPILLDIGAVWCHWCHVMDMESYENDSIANIINEHFVAIKVDRDERPDIDARYQAAVSSIAGQGGWPLTAFLLPDGRVFYGGTYFPPDDSYAHPSFPKVLLALAEAFKNDPTKVLQNAEEVEKFTRQYLSRSSDGEELSPDLIQAALNAVSRDHDVRYGGFGAAPKFPHASVIELLLQEYHDTHEQWMVDAIKKTLRAMAKGGVYDQLGGGFHRYSVDEKWIVPHFEKMLYDNAPLLTNYVHAFQATGDPFFRLVALDILRFVTEVLSDQTKGGFYASQDADVEFGQPDRSLAGDDGSYFTWTIDDARAALSHEEFQVAQLRYNIFEQGEMHHDHRQNVLFVDKSPDEIGHILQKPLNQVMLLLEQAKEKLRTARKKRRAPFVDETIYASWNGMMISSYLEAFKAINDESLKGFALKSLDRILREHWLESGLITHRAAIAASEAFLDDQVEVAQATLTAFEITGEQRYIVAAKKIVSVMIEQFWDDENGEAPSAFNDIPRSAQQVGALKIKNKPITDSPTPGANAVAVLTLLRLETYTGNDMYRSYAERILRYFAGTVKNQGTFAATYFLALDAYLNPPPHIVVVGPAGEKTTDALHQKSLHSYWPLKTVMRIDPNATDSLPPVLTSMRDHSNRPAAYVCSRFTCSPPAYAVDEIESVLKNMAQGVTQ